MRAFFTKLTYQFTQNLRGEKVFEILRQVEKTQWLDREEIRAIQWQKFKKVITHAYDNVPFYRKRFSDFGITPKQIKKWEDLQLIPILSKDDLRSNTDFLMAEDKRYVFDKYSSSGSTGSSSIIYIDRNAAAHRHAVVIRSERWMEYEFSDSMVQFSGSHLDFKNRLKDTLKDFFLNRKTFSTRAFDEVHMLRYFDKIKCFKPSLIYGFTSAIFKFAQFLTENNLDLNTFKIKAVITMGEPLFTHQKEMIAKVFDTQVYEKYGAEEVGAIAYECPEGNLHEMSELVCVEAERNKGNKQIGPLLITDLNNLVMPLIRYKIGDVGAVSSSKCSCGRGLPIIKEISGRSVDFIKTPDGKIMHGINFDYIPKYFLKEIKQFQIIQNDINAVCINLVKDIAFNNQTLVNFEKKLRKLLGNKIKIEYVFKESIPREEGTGKTRFVSTALK